MGQDVKTIETWYEATAARDDISGPLIGDAEAELCVIGGGLAGLTLAREAQRRGINTVLLEAKRIAAGASGRNGGSVSHGYSLGIDDVARHAGKETAQALYRLSGEGVRYIGQQIAEGDPAIRMGEGSITAWRYPAAEEIRRYTEHMQRDYGHVLEPIGREQLRLSLRSERYHGGVLNNEAFHIHPLRYALLQARNAIRTGSRIFEASPVTAITREGGGWRIRTASGTVKARHVALCVSSLDRKLHPLTGRAVLPISTYMIATERLQQDAITTRSQISDPRRAGDYYRLSTDGRILWGGRITTRVSAPQRLGEMLRQDMVSVYPQLGRPRIMHAWSGLMGYTIHKMPLIGRDPGGLWYATAFGGHGLNTTAIAGVLLARAIAGEDDEYRRFAAFVPQWAGGPFGRLGVQGSYWWMQFRDRLDEANGKRKAN
jgi:glycine/D-amino acid oxidase-like deaminating enzyme